MHKDGLERKVVDVKDGGLKDVLVYVKSGVTGTYPRPDGGGRARPAGLHVQAAHRRAAGRASRSRSRTTTRRCTTSIPRPAVNTEFNIGQPRKGMESTKTFDKKEVMIPVGCDVHPWMRSYISVLDNPFFAVTDEDGKFEIKGLPAGEYEIEAVHEKLKTPDAARSPSRTARRPSWTSTYKG